MARLGWIVAAVLGLSSGVVEARPRMQPPFERECLKPLTSAALDACIQRWAKGAKVTRWAPDLEVIRLPNAAVYLYLKSAAHWRMIYILGDDHYELLATSATTVAKRPAKQIELGHVVEIPSEHASWFRERVVLVCDDVFGCRSGVTACTVMKRGRATETFRGRLDVRDDGSWVVVGDRSKTGVMCRSR